MKTLEEIFARPTMMTEIVKSDKISLEPNPWGEYWTSNRMGLVKKSFVQNVFKGMAAQREDIPLNVGTPKAKKEAPTTRPVAPARPSPVTDKPQPQQVQPGMYQAPQSARRNEINPYRINSITTASSVLGHISDSLHNASLHDPSRTDHHSHVLNAINGVLDFRSRFNPEHQDQLHQMLVSQHPEHPITKMMNLSDQDLEAHAKRYKDARANPASGVNAAIWDAHNRRQKAMLGHLKKNDPQSKHLEPLTSASRAHKKLHKEFVEQQEAGPKEAANIIKQLMGSGQEAPKKKAPTKGKASKKVPKEKKENFEIM